MGRDCWAGLLLFDLAGTSNGQTGGCPIGKGNGIMMVTKGKRVVGYP
jgi:hypothetical protein